MVIYLKRVFRNLNRINKYLKPNSFIHSLKMDVFQDIEGEIIEGEIIEGETDTSPLESFKALKSERTDSISRSHVYKGDDPVYEIHIKRDKVQAFRQVIRDFRDCRNEAKNGFKYFSREEQKERIKDWQHKVKEDLVILGGFPEDKRDFIFIITVIRKK